MKCPKCGYNSFEYYDSCKKCSSDLTGYKLTYSITPVLLPQAAKEKLAAEMRSAESATHQVSEIAETHDDIFSFDLPDDSPSVPAGRNDDPFNFDEPLPEVKRSSGTKTEDDVFADLLESNSRAEESSPFTAAKGGTILTPAAVKMPDASSGPGEFDLENFSWDDDTPDADAANISKETADDFDSLFGETKEKNSK
ncbi:MAG: hypothetical protein J0665_10340 [Deltaproteobacteria bacterium]|jgi:predicted  nucleic acid-binding Zn-ribbon protein|nr:hypothetical protein [Deltaproteobacteria bacterium]